MLGGMGRSRTKGIAGAVLGRWRERKKEMIVHMTKEAVQAAWAMVAQPHTEWQKEQHYDCSDFLASKSVERIYRKLDKHCLGPEVDLNSEYATQLLELLKRLYADPNSTKEAKGQAWSQATNIVGRQWIDGPVWLVKEEVDRLKEMLTHYRARKANRLTTMHFGALARALDGEKPFEDEKLDEAEAKALEDARKEWEAAKAAKDAKKEEAKKP
jgi:hypothetical protein